MNSNQNEDLLIYSIIILIILILFVIVSRIYKNYLSMINLKKRIDSVIQPTNYIRSTEGEALNSGRKNHIFVDIAKQIESFFSKFTDDYKRETVERYRLRFEQAGWSPQKAPVITLFSTFCIFIIAINIYLIAMLKVDFVLNQSATIKMIGFILVIFISFRSFEYFMDFTISRRYKRIQRILTFCVDLLAICIRAGFSLDRSFEKIAEEISYYNQDICKEFMKISIELVIIQDRQIALRNFARRVDLPLVHILVGGLVHAEEQGVSIGQTLIMLSQEFSKMKGLELERKAARLPVLLTIPLAIFFLPVIFVLILGPVVINFTSVF